MRIRRLTYADLPQVIAIERRAFPTPWSLAMFVLELSKTSGICLAATSSSSEARPGGERPAAQDGELRGYCICSRYDEVWHIMNVATDPDIRRQGVAKALLDALLDEVGPDARITLEVRRSNTGAMRLYEAYGFLPAGERRSYYQDNGEDAIIMWRTPATLRGALDDVPGLA
jgi:ribosomal-protein-alanine N-acetyltransferase